MDDVQKITNFEPRRFTCLLSSESIVMLFNIVFALCDIKKYLWFNFNDRKEWEFKKVTQELFGWNMSLCMRGKTEDFQSDKISGLPSIAVRNDVKKNFEQLCVPYKIIIIINKICIWLRIMQWKWFNSGFRPKWKSWYLMEPNLFFCVGGIYIEYFEKQDDSVDK